jgi:polar amino acid transport system substrate-binding protein
MPYVKMQFAFFVFLFSFAVNAVELKFITLEVAPWAYRDKGVNELKGVFPEIVREIEKQTGLKLKITLAPFGFSRIDRELESGRHDCTMIVGGKERKNIVVLGEKVLDLSVGVIATKNKRLLKYDDLHGLNVSVHKALSIVKGFSQDDLIKKEYDGSYDSGLRKILHRRVDAVAGVIPTIKYLADQKGMSHLLGPPLVLKSEPIYLQCSKNSKNLQYLDVLNEAIKKMKSNSMLDGIIVKNNMSFSAD